MANSETLSIDTDAPPTQFPEHDRLNPLSTESSMNPLSSPAFPIPSSSLGSTTRSHFPHGKPARPFDTDDVFSDDHRPQMARHNSPKGTSSGGKNVGFAQTMTERSKGILGFDAVVESLGESQTFSDEYDLCESICYPSAPIP
jgi:hypothetical protein